MSYNNILLTGIGFTDGEENAPGIQEDAYLLRYSEVNSLAVPTPTNDPISLMTITGTHLMKQGKSPIPVYTQFEKSGLEAALSGEMYSQMFIQTVKLFLPQLSTAGAANFSVIKNERLILLIRRTGGTGFMQIGCKGLYAKVKGGGKVSTGDGPAGAVGITFEIEAPGIHPYFDYQGVLPVTGI